MQQIAELRFRRYLLADLQLLLLYGPFNCFLQLEVQRNGDGPVYNDLFPKSIYKDYRANRRACGCLSLKLSRRQNASSRPALVRK